MTPLAVLICVLQMTGVMLIALLASARIRGDAPRAASLICLFGLAAGLGVLGCATFGVPRLWETHLADLPGESSQHLRADQAEPVTTGKVGVGEHQSGESLSQSELGSGIGFSITPAVRTLGRWLDGRAVESDRGIVRTSRYLGIVWKLTTTAALVWLAIGIVASLRMHWRSREIQDDRLARMIRDPACGLTHERPIQFREADCLDTPCVTFVGRTAVYLPSRWRHWSDEELLAVIAHEADHLRHRDAAVRLIGLGLAALQALHPLAWRLGRELAETQEMAADRAAARHFESARRYVGVLSRVALRIDALAGSRAGAKEHWFSFTRQGVSSASESQMIRRIEMLIQGESQTGRPWWRLALTMLIAVSSAVMTAGWTLHADEPSESKAGSKVDRPSSTTEGPATRIARLPESQPKTGAYFDRPALQPWEWLRADTGFAAIRVDAMQRHEALQSLVSPFVRPLSDRMWRMVSLPKDAARRAELGLTYENINWAVAAISVEITRGPASDDGDPSGSLNVSSDGLVVQFHNDVDFPGISKALDVPTIAASLEAWGATSKVTTENGATGQEFGRSMINGIIEAQPDPRRLTIRRGVEDDELIDNTNQRRAFRAVDGGLFSMAFTLPRTFAKESAENENPEDEFLRRVEAFAVGLDLSTDGSKVRCRISAVPRGDTTPTEVQVACRDGLALLAKGISEVIDGSDEMSDTEREVYRSVKEAMAGAEVTLHDSDGESNHDCARFDFDVPLESMVALLSWF